MWIRDAGTFYRTIQVEREARRFEFVASDGDATLVVFADSQVALPALAQLNISPKQGSNRDGSFRSRIVPLRAGRNVIKRLPASDLRLHVYGGQPDRSW
ncbi:MAG: hypothetical protein ACI89X_003696 [Planctomycetota bacterium]